MPKKKTLSKAERKRRKQESARRYYLKNKELVTERAKLHMRWYRQRDILRGIERIQSKEEEERQLSERKRAATRGSRMLAQWSRSKPKGKIPMKLGSSDFGSDVGSEGGSTDEEQQMPASLSASGREMDIDSEPVREISGGSDHSNLEDVRDWNDPGHGGRRDATPFDQSDIRPVSNRVSGSLPSPPPEKRSMFDGLPPSSPPQYSDDEPARETRYDDLPPSSPPQYSDEEEYELPFAPYSDEEDYELPFAPYSDEEDYELPFAPYSDED